MVQIAKREFELDIKSTAERFHKAFCYQQKMIPKMCPEIIKDVQLVKGDWRSPGSVLKWTYTTSGDKPAEVAFLLTEAIDDENNSITIRVIDGSLNKMYSFYKFTNQMIKKVNGSSMKCTQEYEKVSDDIPEPTLYSEFATVLYKAMDTYLVNNA